MVMAHEASQGMRYTWVLWTRQDSHWFAPLHLDHFQRGSVHRKHRTKRVAKEKQVATAATLGGQKLLRGGKHRRYVGVESTPNTRRTSGSAVATKLHKKHGIASLQEGRCDALRIERIRSLRGQLAVAVPMQRDSAWTS